MQQKSLYARLELLTPELERSLRGQRFNPLQPLINGKSRLSRLGQNVLRYFVGSQEPRITAQRDRGGYILNYKVYDPVSQSHYTFDSEQELRVWLDQRYYQ